MKKKLFDDSRPWATIFVGVILLIVAGGGLFVTIIQPSTLSFAAYVDALQKLVVGVGILGVGRGVLSAGKSGSNSSGTSQ